MGTTRIGSPEANLAQDIQLVGSHIMSEHCVFENAEGIVTLKPAAGALCYVNGRKVNYINACNIRCMLYGAVFEWKKSSTKKGVKF